MPRLSVEVITEADQYVNAIRDRELNLRAKKIPAIENLGATLDQFDTIDFSDNDICRLDGFPLLKRLKTLLLNNNRICRFAEDLNLSLPNLDTIILTNNTMQDLKDILPLKPLRKLTCLCFLKNPIIHKPHYRMYVIYHLPQVRLLDFRRIRLKERNQAKQIFQSRRMDSATEILPATPASTTVTASSSVAQKSVDELEKIRAAIDQAKTIEDIKRLDSILAGGADIPGF